MFQEHERQPLDEIERQTTTSFSSAASKDSTPSTAERFVTTPDFHYTLTNSHTLILSHSQAGCEIDGVGIVSCVPLLKRTFCICSFRSIKLFNFPSIFPDMHNPSPSARDIAYANGKVARLKAGDLLFVPQLNFIHPWHGDSFLFLSRFVQLCHETSRFLLL